MEKIISRLLKTLLLLLVVSNNAFSQGQSTTQGNDFWLSFGNNLDRSTNQGTNQITFQIRIVATKATKITLTFGADGASETFNVAAGGVYTRTFNATEAAKIYSNSTGISSKSLHIVSDEDISLFAINLSSATTDATHVLPVSNYGQSYRHMTYKSMAGSGDGYTLVACENNTVVSENGTTLTTLNRGQVYSKYVSGGDLTGTLITSDKPIAYFTTNSCVNVPIGTSACDCLFEQQAPVSSWGNEFLVPVTKRGIERVRIVASQDGTKIIQTGGSVITGSLTLNAGDFVELEIALSGGGCHIKSDKPVAVASFLMGTSWSALTYKLGDPAMAWVPPIEQAVMNVALAPFAAVGSSILTEHHALIVTPTATKGSTTMTIGSGSPQALSGGSWTDNAASGYSFYSLQMTQETSTYYFENAAGLTVMGYGLGSAESYYYLAASSARQLNPAFYLNEIHFEDADGQTYCDGPFAVRGVAQLELDPSPGAITWYIDGAEQTAAKDELEWTIPSLSLNDPHDITMIVKDIYGQVYTLTTTITVVDPQPLEITGSRYICPPATSTTLTAESGPSRYQWYKDGKEILGATQNTHTVTSANAGDYSVIGYYGTCVSPMSDTVTIVNGCEPSLTVTYDGNGNTAGTAPVDPAKYVTDAAVTTKLHGDLVRTGGTDPIVFAGWAPTKIADVLTRTTAADTTMAFVREGATFKITDNTTMYAVWSTDTNGNGTPDIFEDGYNVTYDGNGHTAGTAPVDPAKYVSGTTVTTKLHGNLARTGGTDPIVFAGWAPTKVANVLTRATAADTTTAFVREGNTFVIAGATTMYAVWSADTNGNGIPDIFEDGCGVTYDGNGHTSGTVPTDPVKYVSGATVITKLCGNLARTGGSDPIVFAGWAPTKIAGVLTPATAADTTTAFVREGATFVIAGNTTMYAVWSTDTNGNGTPDIFENGYNVSYDGNGHTSGTAPVDPVKYVSGATVATKLHGDLARVEGTDPILFAGWAPTKVANVLTKTTAADTTTAFVREGATFTIAGTTTMYAVWSTDTNGNGIPDIFEDGNDVTYDGNGHTSGMAPVDNEKYVSGATVTTKPHGDLVRTGGTDPILFAGWTPTPVANVLTRTTAADTTTAFVREGATFVIAGATTMYAVWSTDTNGNGIPDIFEDGCGVSYDGNGSTSGTAPTDPAKYVSGATVTTQLHGSLARTGTPAIVFAGWAPTQITNVLTNANAADTTTAFVREGATFVITGNTTMYAVWATDENGNGTPDIFEDGYKVTYDGNGHTSGTAPEDGTTYLAGMKATVKAQGGLGKDDAIFLGWSTLAAGVITTPPEAAAVSIIAVGSELPLSGNTTLYAVWAADVNGPDGGGDGVPDYLQFSVTYLPNGGTGTVEDNNIYNGGMNVTLKDGDFVRSGSVFIGWNPTAVTSVIATQAEENGLTSMQKPGETFVINGDTDWYAVWAKDDNGNGIPDYKEIIITYDPGMATGAIQKDTIESGSTVTFTNMGFKTKNYILIGWNTMKMPFVTTLVMETMVANMGEFYAIGSSSIITEHKTLYAVWAIDANNDGYPDYGGVIVIPTNGTRSLLLSADATDNEAITGARVWSYGSNLYINAEKTTCVRIYTIGGMLYKQMDLPEGITTEPLSGGIYIIEMDGVRYKVVVK